MDMWKYFGVSHRNHTFMNPTTFEKFDEIIRLLNLAPGSKVIDFGCGKAEPLIHITQYYHIDAIGIDKSPYTAKEARENVSGKVTPPSKIEICQMDGADYQVDDSSLDLAICLGASWIFGGMRGTLQAFCKFVRPRGLILIGEPHWLQEPSPEYLKMSGMSADQFSPSIYDNVTMGEKEELTPLYCVVSTKEDFDRYEWMQYHAIEVYALEHPDDPDTEELLRISRNNRREYLLYGRDTLGWAMYLFMKP